MMGGRRPVMPRTSRPIMHVVPAHSRTRMLAPMDDRSSTEPQNDEPVPARPQPENAATRPISVDELSEWSFPASDAPATWTWDPDSPRHR